MSCRYWAWPMLKASNRFRVRHCPVRATPSRYKGRKAVPLRGGRAVSTTTPTPPPDDPAALARELDRLADLLPHTLERLVRERDEAREQWRMSSVCRELQAKLSAAQSAEREARALLEDVVSTSDAHGGIMTSQCDRKEEEHCDCGTRLVARIRAYLARGAEELPQGYKLYISGTAENIPTKPQHEIKK